MGNKIKETDFTWCRGLRLTNKIINNTQTIHLDLERVRKPEKVSPSQPVKLVYNLEEGIILDLS